MNSLEDSEISNIVSVKLELEAATTEILKCCFFDLSDLLLCPPRHLTRPVSGL